MWSFLRQHCIKNRHDSVLDITSWTRNTSEIPVCEFTVYLERHHQCWRVHVGFRATYTPIQMCVSGKALDILARQCYTTRQAKITTVTLTGGCLLVLIVLSFCNMVLYSSRKKRLQNHSVQNMRVCPVMQSIGGTHNMVDMWVEYPLSSITSSNSVQFYLYCIYYMFIFWLSRRLRKWPPGKY